MTGLNRTKVMQFWKDESGVGTLEMILIVAVIVVIAVAFRKWIVQWVENLFNTSNEEMNSTKMDQVNVPTPDE